MQGLGKYLIAFGLLLVVAGLLFYFSPWLPGLRHLGRLPGDISVERPGWRFYFPLGTSILISILLSLIFYLFSRWRQ